MDFLWFSQNSKYKTKRKGRHSDREQLKTKSGIYIERHCRRYIKPRRGQTQTFSPQSPIYLHLNSILILRRLSYFVSVTRLPSLSPTRCLLSSPRTKPAQWFWKSLCPKDLTGKFLLVENRSTFRLLFPYTSSVFMVDRFRIIRSVILFVPFSFLYTKF